MSSRGDPPDDRPDGVPEIPASAWALGFERARVDPAFEETVRTAEVELRSSARAFARAIVGDNEADDAVNIAWAKIWATFDPARGEVAPFFFVVLRRVCVDVLRQLRANPQLPAEDPARWESGHDRDYPDPFDEVIDRIDNLHGQIATAIERLDLREEHRYMLRSLLDAEGADPPTDPKAAVAHRKRRSRFRAAIDQAAGLNPDEQKAASLVRQHHTIAAAAAAAPDIDVKGLYASAKRKLRAWLSIDPRGVEVK